MTDPMMDFFDDANLFGETLEGLSDDAFVQPGPVSTRRTQLALVQLVQ